MRLGALFTVWVVNLSRKCKAHIKAGSAQVVCERAQVHSHLDFDSNRNNFKVQRLKCDMNYSHHISTCKRIHLLGRKVSSTLRN